MKKCCFAMIISMILFSTLPVNAAAEKKERSWQDESTYYLMIDRFNDGNSHNLGDVDALDPQAFNGGDFEGIIDKLDYIKGMGFTTISLTPVFKNEKRGFHGYLVEDFYKTDPHFGSLKTFQKLVSEAHKRKIKIIVDFPASRFGTDHPKEAIRAAKWWIHQTNIDGYHLIGMDDLPAGYWTDFSREIKKEKRNFHLLGSIQSADPEVTNRYERTGVDGFENVSLKNDLRRGFAGTNQPLASLFKNWKQTRQNKNHPYLMGNFLDSPFTTRFTKEIVANKQFPGSRWKMALTYLFTAPGIPIVYYGSEIALNGGEFPDNDRPMNFRTDPELIDYITKLNEVRRHLPSLTRGTMEILYEKNGMMVYKRVYQGETTVVAINNTQKSQHVALTSTKLEDGKELRGLLNGDVVKDRDKQYNLILDRDKAEIYVLKDKTGINMPLIGANLAVIAAFLLFLILILKRRARA